ncbi:MAG: hypothetical protein JW809_15830 [Pirellulales bacterium]|nr:hypothetical protein [Pirellulales bacterium]
MPHDYLFKAMAALAHVRRWLCRAALPPIALGAVTDSSDDLRSLGGRTRRPT